MRLGALASPKVGYARAARAKNLATLASCPQHNRRERDAARPGRSVGSTDGCCRTWQRRAWGLYNARHASGGARDAAKHPSAHAPPAPLAPRWPAARAAAIAKAGCGSLRSLRSGWRCGLRLLDHIAQCTEPFVVRQDRGDVWRLAGANDFALALARCPLRYVLNDELVRTCTALAYSEGDELSGCLDLLRIPAEQLWVEWNEAARREELMRALPDCPGGATADTLRTGILISADPLGRSGSLRTFWLTGSEPQEPLLAAVETLIDLDGARSEEHTSELQSPMY